MAALDPPVNRKSEAMDTEITGRQFFDAINDRNFQMMATLLDADAEMLFPKTQPLIGRKRIFQFLRLLFRKYPQLAFTVRRSIRQEDRVAIHWTNRGRTRTGEPYENEGVTLMELSDGRIRFISDFFKDTDKF
jgi:ketosteroid isomerase-like protein